MKMNTMNPSKKSHGKKLINNAQNPGRFRIGRPRRPGSFQYCRQLGFEPLDIVRNVLKGAFFGGAADQSTLGRLGVLTKYYLCVITVFDVDNKVGDIDFLGPGDLLEPPRKENGHQDDGHPVDDQGSECAVHKKPWIGRTSGSMLRREGE